MNSDWEKLGLAFYKLITERVSMSNENKWVPKFPFSGLIVDEQTAAECNGVSVRNDTGSRIRVTIEVEQPAPPKVKKWQWVVKQPLRKAYLTDSHWPSAEGFLSLYPDHEVLCRVDATEIEQ